MTSAPTSGADEPLLPGLARNATAQFAARVAGAAAQAVGLVLVARKLGPADYGAFALVSTLIVMATVVADWGILIIGARAAAGERDRAGEILRSCLTLRLALGGLAAVGLLVLGFAGSGRADVHVATLVAATSFIPGAWLAAASIRAQLDLRMERVAAGSLAGALASMAWLVAVLALDGGIVALSGSFVANAVVTLAVTLAMTPAPRTLRPGGDRALARRLLRESHPVGVGSLLVTVYFYVDALLLARLSSVEQLGYYDAAYRFVQVGLMVPGVIVTSLFTVAAELARDDRGRMGEFVRELASVLALIVPVPVLALAIAPGDLLAFIYGDPYRPGAFPLAVLSVAVALVFLSGVVGPLLVSLGRERSTLRIAAVATVVNLALNAVLIPLFAARGAAVATVLTELAVLVPAAVLLRRELVIRLDVAQLAKVAGAAVAGAAVVVVVSGPVLARIAAGLLTYVGVLVATGGLSRRLLASMRSGRRPARAVG